MSEPVWLTVDIVRAIHSEAVVSFGGSAGVRDVALLESALDRPRNLFAYGQTPTIFDLAAAYCAGIVRNHPFVDGNKRAGALAAAVFLDLNGYELTPNEAELAVVILALAAGEMDEEALAAWLRENCTRKPG